jgi:PAS domain S-box-containing protein
MDYKKHQRYISWFLNWPITTGGLTFLFLSAIAGFIISQQYLLTKENEHREMNNILQIVHQNIEQSLKNCYTTTLTLALTINDEGIPENFDYVGKKLVETNPSIDAVQIMPKGIIKYTYPLKGNEAAMNLNILKSAYLKQEALKSIKDKKMYFAGPLKLKQGGIGIVGRFPIFRDNKFWGFSAVIIKLKTLIKSSGINSVDNSKYYFQLSKKDITTQKKIFYLSDKSDFSKKYNISVFISDGDWRLYIISKQKNYFFIQILIPAIIGLILSGILGFLVYTVLKKSKELQFLVKIQAEKIVNSEMKFKTIFDQAALGIALVDTESGRFLEINSQFCNLLEYTVDEMKTKNFQSITHPDDLEQDLFNVNKLKQDQINIYNTEKRYITKSGAVVWVNLTVSVLNKSVEIPITNIAIVEDITLRKQNHKLIKISEARFKSLFEDSPIPLWEEDFSEVKKYLEKLNLIKKDTAYILSYFEQNPEVVQKCSTLVKIIDVNNESLKLYKFETKQMLFENLNKINNTESIDDFIKQLIAITRGDKKLVLDSKIKDIDGKFIDINFRWNVIQGYKDSFERVIISKEDVTERRATEKMIFDTKQKIESLINTIDGIVWECDIVNFSFSFVSKKAEHILGYTPEEWMESSSFWASHIHPDDRDSALEYCKKKTKAHENHDFEYRMIAKNGSIVWLRDIVNVIFENGKAVSLRGIMIDITKAKEAEKDLNNSFNLVTEQNKRLLNFSYIVSHNLRSHTSNIESITTLIDLSESEEERNQMIQLLKSVSTSLNETMLHLNEVININTNINLIIKPLNLSQYIINTENNLVEQIQTYSITITSTIPHNLFINYNPAYLESILYNLISNAIRYRHPDRKSIINVKWQKDNDGNYIEISDNGIGIDLVRNRNKIFGMYKTFTLNPDSRGIGLFITRNQIEAMSGKITIESELNVGTTFKIYIK